MAEKYYYWECLLTDFMGNDLDLFSNWELIIGSWAKKVLYTKTMCMLTDAAYTKKRSEVVTNCWKKEKN